MSRNHESNRWFTQEQALVVFTLASVFLAALVIIPYLQFVILGIVFAYVLWPLREWLTNRLRRDVTAFILTIGSVLAIFLPLLFLLLQASRETFAVIDAIEAGELGFETIERWLADFGVAVDLEQFYDDNRETIAAGLEGIAWSVFDIARTLPRIFIGLTITLFVLFILLRDGRLLLEWTRTVLPIPDEIQDELNVRLDRLTRASVVGNVAASLIQAVALAVGLWFIGFENVFFWAVLTFILALLPLVGAFVVWTPLVVYLLVMGDPTAAALLFVWGSIVSVSDFYTRPVVIGHSAALNSAVIVVGVFGGLVAFGGVGLLIGPVILGASKIIVEVLVRERNADWTPSQAVE